MKEFIDWVFSIILEASKTSDYILIEYNTEKIKLVRIIGRTGKKYSFSFTFNSILVDGVLCTEYRTVKPKVSIAIKKMLNFDVFSEDVKEVLLEIVTHCDDTDGLLEKIGYVSLRDLRIKSKALHHPYFVYNVEKVNEVFFCNKKINNLPPHLVQDRIKLDINFEREGLDRIDVFVKKEFQDFKILNSFEVCNLLKEFKCN